MNVLFFKIGNQIIQREKICRAVRGEFNEEQARFMGRKGAVVVLSLYMDDGNEVRLEGDHAEQVWALLQSAAIDITPVKADVANS